MEEILNRLNIDKEIFNSNQKIVKAISDLRVFEEVNDVFTLAVLYSLFSIDSENEKLIEDAKSLNIEFKLTGMSDSVIRQTVDVILYLSNFFTCDSEIHLPYFKNYKPLHELKPEIELIEKGTINAELYEIFSAVAKHCNPSVVEKVKKLKQNGVMKFNNFKNIQLLNDNHN